VTVGVLALQGSVKEHIDSIELAGDIGVEVRDPVDFESIDALIIPGGESTTILKLLGIKSIDTVLIEKVKNGLPVWGTCAGLIILSSLGLIDIDIERNGWGAQNFSFIRDIELDGKSSTVSFIRAPRIKRVGEGVKGISFIDNEIVAIKKGSILGTTFHPELGRDLKVYNYFKSFI
jgi:5'-phosphate synthase pdxT subunit